jgi:hypothetical protein
MPVNIETERGKKGIPKIILIENRTTVTKAAVNERAITSSKDALR